MTRPLNTKTLILSISGIVLLTLVAIGLFAYFSLFGAPQSKAELEQFTIPLLSARGDQMLIDDPREVAELLKEKGFIKSIWGFRIAFSGFKGTSPINVELVGGAGAFKISKSMNAFEIARVMKQEPYMKWVVIPEGLRKEQIAELIGDALGWDQEAKTKWVGNYTSMKYDEIEGVYFPDTYLLPKDETGLQIADRLRAKFNEKFAPYLDKFTKANIKWNTALKIASIVQREAAGKSDMPLVAGIIWNRLTKGMKLETDATVQYARDSVTHYDKVPDDVQLAGYTSQGSWWTPIKAADEQIDSPYNSYLNKGLPPHPICNPGLEAIDAVLNSADTKCLYYLHDSSGQIHCAETYEEHKINVEKYLKN